MSRVTDHFADGWQKEKKGFSQDIREQRQVETKRDSELAAKTMTKLQDAAKLDNPGRTKAPDAAAPLSRPGSDVPPQVVQKSRPETQDAAAKHDARASKEFLKARENAQNLSRLQTKMPVTRSGDQAAVKDAVTQKGPAYQPNIGRQNVQQPQAPVAHPSSQAALRNAAREAAAKRAADSRKAPAPKGESKPAPEKTARPEAQQKPPAADQPKAGDAIPVHAAVAPAVKAEPGARAERGADDRGSESKADGKKKGSEAKQSGGVYAKPFNSGGELGALLSGGSGGAGDQSANQGSDTAAVDETRPDATGALPESDPDFHVYSEFDEANPGVEAVLAKARVFTKYVEKRLVEIAKLDQELDGKIHNIFETTGLSRRIVGELKDELKTADFHRTVYGGLIG